MPPTHARHIGEATQPGPQTEHDPSLPGESELELPLTIAQEDLDDFRQCLLSPQPLATEAGSPGRKRPADEMHQPSQHHASRASTLHHQATP